MKISELGEFGLLERLSAGLAPQWTGEAVERLVVGIGDDAAVWKTGGAAIIATTDTLVSGVHFPTQLQRWRDLGWKATAVNVSDVAAMGGIPEFSLMTLGLPTDASVESVDELYAGVNDACERLGVAVVGGDIVKSPVLFISVTMTGRATIDANGEPQVLRRAAAEAGDLVAVTGTLGGSPAGLRLLRDGKNESEVACALIERHLRPMPRIAAGRAALEGGVRCAIDVSDGLVQDLGQVCRASSVGAVIWADKLPIDPNVGKVFSREEAIRMGATGGEDYELMFTGTKECLERVARSVDLPLTIVGEIVITSEHEAKLLDEAGNEIELPSTGWDHFSSSD